ncbi:MAG TPA: bacillithiol biosynthesis cysteine-adding enzyme BshC [Polyangia bacterium]
MARSFLSAFMSGDPAVRGLLSLDFREPAARARRVAAVKTQVVPPALLAELRAQNEEWPESASRRANLEALARPGTVAVITGQQVGLFLGPLYTFYKAASAVAVARAIEAETGTRCVPVFWLQTEDHDFDEISVCHVLGTGGVARKANMAPDARLPARSSIAHHRLGADVETALASLDDALAMAPGAAEVMQLLRAHYRPGVPVGRAFGRVIAALFADAGLIVFDPRVPAVARLAVPLYQRALDEHAEIGRALTDRKGVIEAAGLSEQVPVRPNCPLVFFHEGSAEGPRYRLERTDAGTWALAGAAGASVADAELRRLLHDDPLRFSSSALLRPLLQDTLFPTAAYVGGPAELAYFAQLGPLYDRFHLPQPLVVLRARLRCVDSKSQRLLAQLGLTAADLDRPEAELLQKLAARAASETSDLPTPAALANELTAAVEPALLRLREVLGATDATLLGTVDRRSKQMRVSLERLVTKYGAALARKDKTRLERLERLKTYLNPEGHPQERHYGWPTMAARAGQDRFARTVADAIVPFSTDIQEICP